MIPSVNSLLMCDDSSINSPGCVFTTFLQSLITGWVPLDVLLYKSVVLVTTCILVCLANADLFVRATPLRVVCLRWLLVPLCSHHSGTTNSLLLPVWGQNVLFDFKARCFAQAAGEINLLIIPVQLLAGYQGSSIGSCILGVLRSEKRCNLQMPF